VRRLIAHGALRLVERSKTGQVVEVRLPDEIRATLRKGIQIASESSETTNRLMITISADCDKQLARAYIDAGCIRVQDGQFLTPFL